MARSLLVLTLLTAWRWQHDQCYVNGMADVPAQLYQLQKSTASPDKIVLQNLPTPLSKRISEKALNWQDLSGYLQRALLWDTGLILTDEGKLIQVHVPCGKTMAQIFLPKEVFDPATCSLEACNLKNLHFASTNCSVDDVFKVSQCAVEDDVQILSKSSVWAEDGDIDSVPDVRLYRFEPDADAITTNRSRASVLFTINQERKVLKTTENCPAKAFFIVPCKQKADTNAGDWCPPSKGGFVDLWLEAERQKTKSAPTSSISAATIFLVLFLVTLVGSMTALIVHTVKKRRQAKSLTSTSLYNTADAESGSVHNSAPRAQPTMMVPSNFTIASNCTSMDIETLNESIRRRSIELSSFCTDHELMLKRIPYKNILFAKIVSKGANGEVWRGEYEGQLVAVKALLPEKRHEAKAIETFAKEIRLASNLDHPNIVRFIGLSWRRLTDLCSISEFMNRGDLSDVLASKQSSKLTWHNEKLNVASDIANALVYLHSLVPLIIHRDLKSMNVLLDNQFTAKLSDFGLSRERSFEETMTSGIGTLLWTAPEILRGEAYSEKADIFSYGIVLSELDTCLPPYSLNDEVSKMQLKSMQLMHLVTKGKITPRFRADCPPALEQLARSCLDPDPVKRPNAMQVVFALRSKVRPQLLISM